MGTSNFHSNITPARYVISDENDETIFQDTISNIESTLEDKIKYNNITIDDTLTIGDELRSFSSKSIAKVYNDFDIECNLKFDDGTSFDDYQIEYSFILVARSGYYDGINIDISDEVYSLEGNGEYIHYESDGIIEDAGTLGIKSLLLKNMIKECEELKKQVLDVVDLYTNGMEIIATLSNGETVAREVD